MPTAKPYIFSAKYKPIPTIAPAINTQLLGKWGFPLALWGFAAGSAVFFFADSIPVFKKLFYVKLPVFGPRYDDSVDPQDSPF
ncbi:hypothetical protein TRVA0_055S00584 [Trichomonascus vanleenenianus]|uniref:ubiquinol--cytochrome-c reductase subunit 10 n=1 Tax=Trichomonascus vanleenenianus TaxID=2268995 RepID=UPI003ECAC1B7